MMSGTRAGAPAATNWFTRPELVSAVFFIGFVNGVTEVAFQSVERTGFPAALSATFGISVLVLVCAYLAVQSAREAPSERPSRSDFVFCLALIPLYSIPVSFVTWIAMTALALREYIISEPRSLRRRAAVLMFGLTIPMFWSRLIFTLLSGWILRVDAILVSLVVRSPYHGNVVMLPHDTGFLYIAAPCSSLANMSQAMLCWLLFTEYSGRRRTANDYATCVLACASVIVLNVLRISWIALRPDLYEIIHGPFGATVFGYFSTFVVVAICAFGVRRERDVVSIVKDRGDRSGGAVSCGTEA